MLKLDSLIPDAFLKARAKVNGYVSCENRKENIRRPFAFKASLSFYFCARSRPGSSTG